MLCLYSVNIIHTSICIIHYMNHTVYDTYIDKMRLLIRINTHQYIYIYIYIYICVCVCLCVCISYIYYIKESLFNYIYILAVPDPALLGF